MAGLPNITGQPNGAVTYGAKTTGAIESSAITQYKVSSGTGGSMSTCNSFDFNASRCSAIYGRSNTVVPTSLKTKYFIKYT